MKNHITHLAFGRILPVALLVAAGATLSTPAAAASSDHSKAHKSTPVHATHTSGTSTGLSFDDHPPVPKPTPHPHGHRRHKRPHPTPPQVN